MKKFFVPSKWEKNAESIKFTTNKVKLSGGGAAVNKNADNPTNKKKPNKNKKKTDTNKYQHKKDKNKTAKTKGPLAPTPPTTPRVKQGRIEKKKNQQKKKQQKLKLTPATARAAAESLDELPATASKSTIVAPSAFEAKLKEQLMGGRFRYLNEQLYSIHSGKAQQLFAQDRDAFAAYHEGYRHQVDKWPLNPLDRIAKMLRKLPKSLEIGDFGCGDGKLAQIVPNKVHSMDLVSCRDDIIACDMASTPLTAQTLDIAVYCLSLMGTNLNDYLLEANRVLKMGGLVYIAEIQSRFDDNVHAFIKCLQGCGFDLVKRDVSVKLFYFFQFKKVRDVGKVARLQPFSLKPCLYRKR